MDLEKLEKVFEEDLGELLIGLNGFHFYRKEEIGEGQIGYRCNADYVKIEEWIGDTYFVIGKETLLGDPIVVNIEEESLPVYRLVYDDWSICKRIANSIEDYRKILKLIMDSDLSLKEELERVLSEIKMINQGLEMDYWRDFLEGVHEDISTFYE